MPPAVAGGILLKPIVALGKKEEDFYMKKVVICILIVILLISAVTVTVMYKLGEKFLEEMMLSDSEELENITLDMVDGDRTMKAKESGGNGIFDEGGSNRLNGNGENTDNTKGNSDGLDILNKKGELQHGQSGNEDALPSKNSKREITKNKLQQIKEEVTFFDKMAAASLVVKRLSTEDITELKGLAEGGLSPTEKKKAKEIAYEKFTNDEIKEIKKIYYKYMK